MGVEEKIFFFVLLFDLLRLHLFTLPYLLTMLNAIDFQFLLVRPAPQVDECSNSDSDKTLDAASTAALLSPYHHS